MIIQCQKSLLRPWQIGDENSLCKNADNKKIWDQLRDQFPHPYTLKDAEAWLEMQIAQSPVTNFAIEVEGLAVGGIGLIPGKDVSRVSAEMGYWLGENYWGQGIISEAVLGIVNYGFETLNFSRIFAEVFASNAGSMKVLEKNGFVKEAVFKNAIIKNGKIIDTHCFAIWPKDARE